MVFCVCCLTGRTFRGNSRVTGAGNTIVISLLLRLVQTTIPIALAMERRVLYPVAKDATPKQNNYGLANKRIFNIGSAGCFVALNLSGNRTEKHSSTTVTETRKTERTERKKKQP